MSFMLSLCWLSLLDFMFYRVIFFFLVKRRSVCSCRLWFWSWRIELGSVVYFCVMLCMKILFWMILWVGFLVILCEWVNFCLYLW